MNVNWCLLFAGVLVFIFNSVQINSSSSAMAKGKRARKKAQNKRSAHSRGGSLNKEKINKRQRELRAKKRKSGPPTDGGKQSQPGGGGKQSEQDVPTSKAPPSKAGFPSKVRYSKAYKSIIYQHPSLL